VEGKAPAQTIKTSERSGEGRKKMQEVANSGEKVAKRRGCRQRGAQGSLGQRPSQANSGELGVTSQTKQVDGFQGVRKGGGGGKIGQALNTKPGGEN